MQNEIKSAFIMFEGQVVVVTKSLISGFMNTTHHGTDLALAEVKTVAQLEDVRTTAEKEQFAYFESANGQAFIKFQQDNDVETYASFEEAGDLAVFPDGCYEDAQAFIDAIEK